MEMLRTFDFGDDEDIVRQSDCIDGVKKVIRSLAANGNQIRSDSSLAEHLEAIAKDKECRRSAALFVLRAIGTKGVIKPTSDVGKHFELRVVSLTELALPDICKQFQLTDDKQTIEKYDILVGIHAAVMAKIQIFTQFPTESSEYNSRRQDLFRAFNNNLLKSYLSVYGFAEVETASRAMINGVCELEMVTDASFGLKLQDLFESVEIEMARAATLNTFFTKTSYLPLLSRIKATLLEIESKAVEKFDCLLKLQLSSSGAIERRYPLHFPEKTLRITLPFENTGPGIALSVKAIIVSGSEQVYIPGGAIEVGDITAGRFSISFEMLIEDALQDVPLLVEISWKTARGADRKSSFETSVLGQDENIDWNKLDTEDPYSTEVAQGDEFVGRSQKVAALVNRILKQRMQSSYITGQKRVGKTSLALAVEDDLSKKSTKDERYEVIYVEYGEYAGADAVSTLNALGNSLATSMARHLPPSLALSYSFDGSLAPLNAIAQAIYAANPELRFIVILDEFDEIHPEMYRHGPLAEAFFSNLRTFSAKKNIAIILVGGENMPFIIGAQGDQLNKFIREPLDYFSRSTEWDNFCDLVTLKKTIPLSWHESALTELFNHTNGHPYYTKLICAKVFANAVADRDAEVTIDEVRRAVRGTLDALDTNVFAHFWKDGVPQSREEAEVTELKRCRLLASIGRVLRNKKVCTIGEITESKISTRLKNVDVIPLLQDLCRREIMRERGNTYEFVLPFFQQWLTQTGFSKLVVDTLGDELADALEAAEDKAYVTAAELGQLVDKWGVFRGQKVTSEDLRRWLEQRSSYREQRLLFKIASAIQFHDEASVREKLRLAHSIVKKHTTAFIPKSRSQRRYDILVSYVDALGKSGSRYADKYAEENLISVQCVIPPDSFSSKAAELEAKNNVTTNGIVIVDDIVATGKSFAENISIFYESNKDFIAHRSIHIIAIAILATSEGEDRVRKAMQRIPYRNMDLRVCSNLDTTKFAFNEANSTWDSLEELAAAKALNQQIVGSFLKEPALGFGEMGLLTVFFDTCPNNTLPIIHSEGKGWFPLFRRITN